MERTDRRVDLVAQRSYWREADARLVVEAWRQSGESQRAFAARYRIDPKRVARWATRLSAAPSRVGRRGTARRAADRVVVRFHPVAVVEPVRRGPAVPVSPDGPPSPIEVLLQGGRLIRVPRGFAPEDLHHVLIVLEAITDPPRSARC